MSTAKLTIRDGIFTDVFGVEFIDQKSAKQVVANGWNCRIEKDGSLRCIATEESISGTKTMMYHVRPDGFARQTLKEPGKKIQVIKKGFAFPKDTKLEGTLGLSGGELAKRYVYFRTVEFQKFLDEHGITAVNYSDVSLRTEYELRHALYRGGVCQMKLETDGIVEKVSEDHTQTEIFRQYYPGTMEYLWKEVLAVTDANWVILTKTQHEGKWNVYARILYTIKNPVTLNLPKKV